MARRVCPFPSTREDRGAERIEVGRRGDRGKKIKVAGGQGRESSASPLPSLSTSNCQQSAAPPRLLREEERSCSVRKVVAEGMGGRGCQGAAASWQRGGSGMLPLLQRCD